MKIRKWIGWLAMMPVLLVGCSSGSAGDESMSKAEPTASSSVAVQGQEAAKALAPQAPKAQTVSLVQRRAIVRHADVGLRVENVEKAERSVNQIVTQAGGYVDSAQSSDLASVKPTLSVTARVPVDQFDSVIAQFEKLGVRLSKTVSSEDVTGQIVDLDARLKTLAAEEETYRGILRGTHDLGSMLPLQDKLTEVRTQIESIAAQRKALSGQAALSTITLHLEQAASVSQPATDPNWLAQTWGESTTLFGIAARAVAQALIWLVVFSPLWAPAAFLIRRYASKPREVMSAPPKIGPS